MASELTKHRGKSRVSATNPITKPCGRLEIVHISMETTLYPPKTISTDNVLTMIHGLAMVCIGHGAHRRRRAPLVS